MNDEESAVANDFLSVIKRPKVTIVDIALDDEFPIFFRDRDEKTSEECFFTAILVPKGTDEADDWWVSGDRANELVDIIKTLGGNPENYTWKDKGDSTAIHFSCKNRKKWTIASVIKSHVALRLQVLKEHRDVERRADAP